MLLRPEASQGSKTAPIIVSLIAHMSVLAAVAKQERVTISERTRAGLQRALKAGHRLGRRPVRVDLLQARKLRAQGLGLRPVAGKLRISVNTLRNALAEA